MLNGNPHTPKDKSTWNLWVTLFGKRVLADVIKIRILRRDYPGLSRWALNPITSVLIRKDADGEGHVETDAEFKLLQPQVGNTWRHQKLEAL